jgi:hypothetical protein
MTEPKPVLNLMNVNGLIWALTLQQYPYNFIRVAPPHDDLEKKHIMDAKNTFEYL